MCGIIGYKGPKKAQDVLLYGLSILEYRGYDSAGIAYFNKNKIKITKSLGPIKNLKSSISYEDDAHVGIGHTRWATHGNVTIDNCHPHRVGKITLVHNGIIENYQEIKDGLIKKGYSFKGDTDSEVACALIDYNYKITKNTLQAINDSIKIFVGSYALLILNEDENDCIYATRNNSPLIVSRLSHEFYFASDVPAILKYTNQYYLLDNKEIVKANNNLEFYDQNLKVINKEVNTYDLENNVISKENYEHYMLKEINEIKTVVKNTISPYICDISKLKDDFCFLDNYEKIEIVACGSAYHAGLVGEYLINNYSDIEISTYIASEYRYKKHHFKDKTLLIIISQSGETADSLAALKIAKENNIDILAIVNVFKSSIARNASRVIYTKAGTEIAVATTKAYVCQITVLSLMAMYLKSKKYDIKNDFEELQLLPNKIEEVLKYDITKIAKKLYLENDIYFIGRQIDYYLCMEASLKLKEISYIHSEAYAAGELKHGSIALINDNTKVIAIDTDDSISLKTISNIKEVKARKASVLFVTNKYSKENEFYDESIIIPKSCDLFQPILTIIPMQKLAYYIAKYRGCEIDKPKNLAKSVTVE